MNTMRIFFAGEMFDHKHLSGNALLGEKIEQLSNGRYHVHLPQDQQPKINRPTDIRDLDYQQILMSDFVIFNFDGTDLDSGTTIEYLFAKMCDIPSIVFRSDFRKSGNQSADQDPWNLMISGYPRTKRVLLSALGLYRECKCDKVEDRINLFHSKIASSIIEALDEVCKVHSLFEGNKEKAKSVYQWVIKAIGGSLNTLLPENELVQIIEHKHSLGLI